MRGCTQVTGRPAVLSHRALGPTALLKTVNLSSAVFVEDPPDPISQPRGRGASSLPESRVLQACTLRRNRLAQSKGIKHNPEQPPVSSCRRYLSLEPQVGIIFQQQPGTPKRKRGLQPPKRQSLDDQREQRFHVNPYTQQQYAYLQHRHRDEARQVRKKARNKQRTTFSNSYSIAAVQLSLHRPRQKRSLLEPTPKVKTVANGELLRSPAAPIDIQFPSPSPWDWGRRSYSMHRDFLDRQD